MESVILVIHLFLALAIIGLVLLQRSEGGGLGIGGGGGLGNLASARGTANALSRATAICAAAFFCTSLALGILAGSHSQQRQGILEALGTETPPVSESPAAALDVPVEVPAEDMQTEKASEETGESKETPSPAPSVPIAE